MPQVPSLSACLEHNVRTGVGGSTQHEAAHTNRLLQVRTLHATKLYMCMRKHTLQSGKFVQAKSGA